MYAQDYSFYRRPDTSHVTWLTPQQLEAARVARSLAPIKVLEVKPIIRAVDEKSDVQNLLAAAPALLCNAIRKGLAVIHREMPVEIINKGVRKFTMAHRRKLSAATKQRHQTK